MLLQDDTPDDAQQRQPEDTDNAATVQLLQSAAVSWQHPVRKSKDMAAKWAKDL